MTLVNACIIIVVSTFAAIFAAFIGIPFLIKRIAKYLDEDELTKPYKKSFILCVGCNSLGLFSGNLITY